jgi:hypothetical protein
MRKITCFQFTVMVLGVLLRVGLADADIPAEERAALIAFYNSTGGGSLDPQRQLGWAAGV